MSDFMKLSEKQRLFAFNIGKLIIWTYGEGYELTFGEAQRSQAQAEANAKSGKGVANSLHLIRLAIDLNLFIKGQYVIESEAHRPLGEYWKSLHPLNCWGGDFKRRDGNHYSMQHDGMK